MEYYALIDEYLDLKKSNITAKSRADYRRAMTAGVDFLTLQGYSQPNDDFFANLKSYMLQDHNESTVAKKLLPQIRKFFAWTAKAKKGEITLNEQPLNVDNSTRKKRGRKMLGEEHRTEKVTIYLTPTLDKDAHDLANLDGLRFADYIFKLIQQDTQLRNDKLQTLRNLREQ